VKISDISWNRRQFETWSFRCTSPGGGSVSVPELLRCFVPVQLGLAIPPWVGIMSYDDRSGRNGLFCVTVGPVTRTAGIMTQSVNRAGRPADLGCMLDWLGRLKKNSAKRINSYATELRSVRISSRKSTFCLAGSDAVAECAWQRDVISYRWSTAAGSDDVSTIRCLRWTDDVVTWPPSR